MSNPKPNTQLLLIVILLTTLTACTSSYSFKLFSFPPNTQPHDNDWTYLGKIVVYDKPGISSTEMAEKTLEITVTDTQGNELLTDHVIVVGGSFRYHIQWESLENLHIEVNAANSTALKPLLSLNYQLINHKFIAIQ